MIGHIDAAHRAQLSGHSNAAIAERARRILSSSVDPDRRQVIGRYTEGTRGLLGDPQRGREVFGTLCTACHRFGQIPGGAIGPDIANINDRSAAYLIDHILAPNQAVEGRYILYTATTNDGRSLSGMVTGEAGNSITLLGIDGVEQVILRSELQSLSGTGRSLMPDGLEVAIDFQAMADLIVFIAQSGGVAAP
jgi:putative heme-binding domain-containing protein